MADTNVMAAIRGLVATGTNDPVAVEVDGRDHEGTVLVTVRFNAEPARLDLQPLLTALNPITKNCYSNEFGEKGWTIEGEYAGRKVSVSFRVKFLVEKS